MIFELSKTKIRLSFSFAAVVTVMLISCDGSVALVSLFCSLLHELGHIALLFFSEILRARWISGRSESESRGKAETV